MNFTDTLKEMDRIHTIKNADYASEKDPYKNFRLCSHIGLCSVEEGILVRMTDKLGRIVNILGQEAQVEDEKITDTLLDLANYAVILKCYLEEHRLSKQ